MLLPLTVSCVSKSRLVLPFRYQLTRVVPDKGPADRCYYHCCWVMITTMMLSIWQTLSEGSSSALSSEPSSTDAADDDCDEVDDVRLLVLSASATSCVRWSASDNDNPLLTLCQSQRYCAVVPTCRPMPLTHKLNLNLDLRVSACLGHAMDLCRLDSSIRHTGVALSECRRA